MHKPERVGTYSGLYGKKIDARWRVGQRNEPRFPRRSIETRDRLACGGERIAPRYGRSPEPVIRAASKVIRTDVVVSFFWDRFLALILVALHTV
jgi:hypothetical protein